MFQRIHEMNGNLNGTNWMRQRMKRNITTNTFFERSITYFAEYEMLIQKYFLNVCDVVARFVSAFRICWWSVCCSIWCSYFRFSLLCCVFYLWIFVFFLLRCVEETLVRYFWLILFLVLYLIFWILNLSFFWLFLPSGQYGVDRILS